nr:RNA-directed DNA polymerase, eukaryota, reverse transcriptase zinc-binding domain protein [Tanacetum cinerariifolium]
MDSNESDDDHDMEEHKSTNEDVDPNAALDDFIQQNIVKESALKDSKEGDQANVSTHVAGDNETLFSGKVKEEYFVIKEDKPSEEDVSDTSKPPGFEFFIKENSECLISSNASRSGKCSTSFGNYKIKELKDFSFIDETSRMIEVGMTLGYDVKGCKKSLRKMINGIGGLVTMWDPNVFVKKRMCGDAAIFNDFIQESGLSDLLVGGKSFTWINKVGSKMSKLDQFLISDNVNHDIPNLQVVALDRRWSDHNPILLHLKNFYFGSTPFRIFHSWFDRIDFEKVVKDKWDDITREVLGHTKFLHTKLKDLKSHVKIRYSHTKEVETSRMNLLLADMRNLDQKINKGLASDEDKSSRIIKLQELDYFEKMNSLDLMQKSRVKWEVEGNENSKFFHGLINSRRKSQSIHGIMHEGVWLSDPKDIKEAFINFYKKKFSCHDSQISFPSFMPAHRLNTSDQDLLEAVVSMEEIKTAVWDCGSNKAPGVNSAFITLIPKVSNPLFIKDYRPISLIGLHYKIVAKILSNRLYKVIDSIISPEQSAFISGRQILDGPLILSEIIDWPITMGRSKTEFDNLIIDISNMEIDDLVESDTCVWSLSNDDSFSVNSVRKHIDEHSLASLFPCTRWYKMIPKKVNVFMRRMLLDRLLNRLNLSSRGLDIDSISCMVCNGHVESNDHIFFTCDTAVAIWNLVRSWIDLPLPSFLSCDDWTNWFDSWHVYKDKKSHMYSIFAATCWTLWGFRNNITFNSHSMRKCDIFDFIRNVSFSWLKYRGKD